MQTRKIRKDLTGHKYGKLTVLKLSEQRLRGIPSWDCLCECGNLKTSCAMDLRAGQVTSCGCAQHKGTPKDISGVVFFELTALESTNIKSNNGDFIWKCACSCGTSCEYPLGQLNSGSATNCGCKTSSKISAANFVHGMKDTPEYRSWSHARERIFNSDCPEYLNYGARGLTFESDWGEFIVFINEIGLMPDDGKRYTIDRIKNNLGYIRGNVRWATNHQQARNKTFQLNNTSGVSGVTWDNKKWRDGGGETLYANAIWADLESGKQMRKCFSTKIYGLLPAFKMACEHRAKMIAKLNSQGAGYSESHGK